MNTKSLFTAALLISPFFVSCGYKYHLPRGPEADLNIKVIQMKVGERRRIVSEQLFSEFNMLDLTPPCFLVQSSNPKIIKIDDSHNARTAWIVALQEGRATVSYYPFDSEDTIQSVIEVTKQAQQDVAPDS